MKPSIIEEREALGRHFDAIRDAHSEVARAQARVARLIEDGRRFGQAIAHNAARVPGARWDAREVAERELPSELACTIRVPQRSAENL
ncbi:MAG: hypothetical protein H7311_11995, partial [Ramlibacter sp.]|nr:hypothetical protein [Cryobacterium sp.]